MSYREIIHNRKMGRIILLVTWIYVFLVIVNFFFIQKATSFNSMTYALGCLLITAVSIYYFYELFQMPHSVNLVRQPAFWICCGLLFFYCCSFPIYGLLNYLKKPPHVMAEKPLQGRTFIECFLIFIISPSLSYASSESGNLHLSFIWVSLWPSY